MSEEEKEKVIKKWSALGLMEGLGGNSNGYVMGVDPAVIPDPSQMGQLDHPDTFPSLLPIAMKVVAKTIALDLVSVSPLDPPGLVFKPAIERLRHQWEMLKKIDPSSDQWSYKKKRVMVEMQHAFKGISEESIEQHISNPAMMEKLLNVGEASNRFNV
jgi:hypothetical protein